MYCSRLNRFSDWAWQWWLLKHIICLQVAVFTLWSKAYKQPQVSQSQRSVWLTFDLYYHILILTEPPSEAHQDPWIHTAIKYRGDHTHSHQRSSPNEPCFISLGSALLGWYEKQLKFWCKPNKQTLRPLFLVLKQNWPCYELKLGNAAMQRG